MEWKNWQNTSFKSKDHLPSYSGIYVVADKDDRVWYVGQAKNIYLRWQGKSHHRYPQLNRSHKKFNYTIYYHPFPLEKLDEKERYYINSLNPELNNSEVKQYLPKVPSLEEEIKRILKVLNKPNSLYPTVRSLILGQYQDDNNTIHVLCLINTNDYDILQNSATRKHGGLVRNAWSGLYEHSNRIIGWIDTPIYTMSGYQFEFYGGLEVINYLERYSDQRSRYLEKATILGIDVLMIKDLTILTLSKLPLEDKLKEKLPLLENKMNTNNQQESQTQSEALVTPSLPKKMTRWLVNVEDVEVEICKDDNEKYYVRHNLFWYIVYNDKCPDSVGNRVMNTLKDIVNSRLSTIWWAGYSFKFEELEFEDGLITEAVLLPLKMFEDFLNYFVNYHYPNIAQTPNSFGPSTYKIYQLGKWLQNNSLEQFKK
ncbi:GIY-YIG nuclease family protein [Crocosphaera sp.]|uniref:GIY-YIG nuclease family protein n=1 Tax=Crocosphaera sp. TaxID=2729996 RepID=UPI003F22B298|nr:GIY-YIG nuclease family protein [Crocosphaera sp.]